MSTKQTNCTIDFYHQLSLLLKSDLPLPGSIRSLAAGFRSSAFRREINQLADSVESGETLCSAMRRHPGSFPARYVEVVEAGERSGTLADALHELGVSARADYQVASLCRDILFYPVIVVFVLAALFIMLCVTTIHPLGNVFGELLDYTRSTPYIIVFADFIAANLAVIAAAYLLALGGCCWLLSGSGAANRLLLGIVRFIPGVAAIFDELTNARLCIFWSMLLKQALPDKKAFPFLTLCTDDRRLKKDLAEIGEKVNSGVPVADALEAGAAISPVIQLTFRHVPESRIPEELEKLSGMFLERASAALRRIGVIGEVVATLVISLVILLVFLSMFRPFLQIMTYL